MSIHSTFRKGGRKISKKGKNNDKYNRILEAAVKIFATHGFFQATISQIAKEAGVADGTIYLYFKNKEDIFHNFFTYKTKEVFEGFREEVDNAESADEKLKNLIKRHLREFQRDRNMAVVYQAGTRHNYRLAEDKIKTMTKMYLDMVGEIIEQGQMEGKIRKDLYLSLVKRFIMGAVDEVVNAWVLSGGKYDLETMADPLLDLLIRGIGTAGDKS